ncbi:MAG: mechanosensitive ion channel family protein [Saprospiraceae bacterium]
MEDFKFDLQPLYAELQTWYKEGIKLLPNILLATLALVFGIMLTRFLRKYFDRLANKITSQTTVASLLSSIMTFIFGVLVLLLVLSIMGMSGTLQSILAGAGVVGLAVGLAFQDPILNLFSGIIISTQSFFNLGDLVEISDKKGIVSKITLRTTQLRSLQGQEIVIPNKDVAQGILVNYSVLKMRRVDVSCGVSYGDDLRKVKKVTIQAVKDAVPYDESKDVQLFFNEFGDSSINYTLRFWMDERKTDQASYLDAQSKAIIAIAEAYDANDIMIPFPIRTLDFGIKGGEKLNEMLGQSPGKVDEAAGGPGGNEPAGEEK